MLERSEKKVGKAAFSGLDFRFHRHAGKETISYYDPSVATLTHTAPSGSLSQTFNSLLQSVAAMAGQGSASTVLPANGGMTLEQIMTVTKPV